VTAVSDYKAVDLFCGAGGASIGLERLNVDVVGAVDKYEEAIETYADCPETSVEPWNADLTEVDFQDIADHFEFDPDDIDIVMGCPPCQNFSSLRDTEDWDPAEPKDELLLAFVRLVAQADPDVVIFENVPGLLAKDGGQYVRWLKHRMNPEYRQELLVEPESDADGDDIPALNYGMAFEVVNAADYGVPQKRRRTIGLFVKGASNEDVEIPEPTHSGNPESDRLPWRTVEDAIGDLPALERGEEHNEIDGHRARRHQENTMEIIRAIPDGGDRRDLIGTDLELDCHQEMDDDDQSAANIYGRMWADEPAPTLTTRCTSPSCGRFLHPDQDRALTFREAARLMTFPDKMQLPSKNNHAERVVGNAVPPILIQNLVGRFLRECISASHIGVGRCPEGTDSIPMASKSA